SGAVLSLTPPSQALAPTGTASQTATLKSGCGNYLAGASVKLTVLSGPNAGLTRSGTTASGGSVTLTYPDTTTAPTLGIDRNQATVTNLAGTISSPIAAVIRETAT